jgi:hypothetical protein
MERNGKPGSIRGTSMACQALLPAKTPMRPLCAGQDFLSGWGDWRWCWHGSKGEDNRFAAYHLQPFPSDATAWPVFPHHRSKRERGRSVFKRRGGSRGWGREWPEHRIYPPRLDGFTAFLTLRTQGTASAMADTRSIQHPKGAVALRPALLWVQRMIGGAAQRPIVLQSTSGARKAPSKRRTCPLGRTIFHRRRLLLRACGLDGGSRPGDRCMGKFRRAQLGRGELLPQFQAEVPHLLAQDLPELLPMGGMRTPPVGILLHIFRGSHRLKRAAMQVEIEHIPGKKSRGGKRADKQLVDGCAGYLGYPFQNQEGNSLNTTYLIYRLSRKRNGRTIIRALF